VGRPLDEEAAAQAAESALAEARPLRHNAYKIQMARTALQRAILSAAGQASHVLK
jgi:xanthine dehydrogenase YagS FAD-binding subunit